MFRISQRSFNTYQQLFQMAKIEGLNSEELAKGSVCPVYHNDKIRLYNMRFCPYAQRTCLILAAKNIPYKFEVVNINLMNKPQWFSEKINPLGKVPAIQVNDKIIYESLISSEWIDERFTGSRKILPKDHYERANQKMLIERLSKLPSSLISFRKSQDEKTLRKVHEAIQLHEQLLNDNFFAGKECGFVDYMVWPFLERLEALDILSNGKLTVTKQNYPNLVSYIERMKLRPEIKAVYCTPEEHLMYFQRTKKALSKL